MWFNNVRLILPDRVIEHGAIEVDGSLISAIAEQPIDRAEALDLPGITIMPGIVELHGDMIEREIEPRPGARFPTEVALYELDKRLAATGITTAFAAISFAWTHNDLRSQDKAQDIIHVINAQRAKLLIDMRVHARFEITNSSTAAILNPLLEAHLIDLVSIMDHTPGQGQYGNIDRYVEFMTRWLGADPDAVGEATLERLRQSIKQNADRPRDWDIVRAVVEVALAHGIPVASHDDDTIEKVDRLADLGVTISEFPVTHVIMGAPNAYRGLSNTGNLSALDGIRAGLVDILATDYVPAAPFQAALKIAAEGDRPLHEAIRLVTINPADAIGLSDRGRLAVRAQADLVFFEQIDQPRVRATFRAGRPIYWDGTFQAVIQANLVQSAHVLRTR